MGGADAWRRLRVILTALVFCRGTVLLCVLPPFEGWDEYQHVGYIVYWNENGERPWLGQANVPTSLLARLPAFPHCNAALRQMGGLGAADYATFWERHGRSEPPVANPTISLYQAQHGPLYYALVGPLFEWMGGVGHLKVSVGGLRLVNLLLTTGSVWVALGIVSRMVRDRRLAAFSGLAIATQPLFLMNGVRVANDALGVFLATVSIARALDPKRRDPVGSAFGLGLFVGLAVLAKSVHFGIIPCIVACWLWKTWREGGGKGAVFRGALALACGFLFVTQSEFRGNWARYGSVTVMQEAILNRAAGHGLGDLVRTARSISWFGFVRDLWLRKSLICGGWSWVSANPRMVFRHELLVVTGLLGWAWLVFPTGRARIDGLFRETAFPWLCLLACAGYTASLGGHAVVPELCWGAMSTNPWYAAAAYPWFLLLVTAGALTWPLGRLRYVHPVLLTLFFLETESSIVLGSMVARYTPRADWSEALRRLASLQAPPFGTSTFYAAIGGVLVLASLAITQGLRAALSCGRAWRSGPIPPRKDGKGAIGRDII